VPTASVSQFATLSPLNPLGRLADHVRGAGAAELLGSESRRVGDTVYLGDSITDLPALMAADYGIVIRQSTKLRDILAAAGIAVAPLGGAPMRSRGPASVTGVLYTAEWCAHPPFAQPNDMTRDA
jgi:hypothetical protein